MMNNLDELLDLAFNQYNSGLFEEAEKCTREALVISPKHGDALYLLGLIAYKKGIYTQSLDILNTLIKLYPKQQNYQLALAEVYQHHGDFEKALQIYKPYQTQPNVQIQLGWIYLAQNKKEKAKKLFKKLIQSSEKANALYGLACCSNETQKLKYLQNSFDENPSNEVAQDLYNYYLDHKKLQKAESFLPYIEDDLLKSRFYMIKNDYDLAQDLLFKHLTKNPYNQDAHLFLGIIFEKKGQLEEAEKHYNQVLLLNPKSIQAHKGLAQVLMKEEKLPYALDHYQIVLNETPDDKESLLAVAITQEGLKDYKEALGLYFRLLTLNQKGLDQRIKSCIEKLSKEDPKIAENYIKGWAKHYPKNKIAQKLLKTLLSFLIVCTLSIPLKAEFLEDANWEISWHSKMAQMGDPQSQFELGEIFEQGKIVPKNIAQAINYYQKAAAQGYYPAMLRLGNIFNQKHEYYNPKKSLEWYTYAAQKGDPQAQFYLAEYYQDQNPQLAKEWHDKAMKQVLK